MILPELCIQMRHIAGRDVSTLNGIPALESNTNM
jgi:hypothetical protein